MESWERNVWALALVVFIAFVGFQFFSPFLPLYVIELGVTEPTRVALWSGVLTAVTPAVSGLLGPLWGRFADRVGRKMMMIRSLAGFVIIVAAMGLVTSVTQLLILRVLQGVIAGFSVFAMALASVSCPKDKVPVAIGRVQGAQLLSVAIGPAAGGYVASHFGLRYAFFVTAGMCAIALVGLILLFDEGRPHPADGDAAARRESSFTLRDVLGLRGFPLVLGLLFIGQFIDRGLSLLVPLKVAALPDVTRIAATSGEIISLAAICATGSALAAGRLAQRWPPERLLLVGLLLGGLPCALMALAPGWQSLMLLRCLTGLCLGGALTLAYSLGGTLVPGERRGAAFGWLALSVQVGTAASPLVSGGLAALSLPGAFMLDGGLAWLGAAVLLLLGTRRLRRGARRLERSTAGPLGFAALARVERVADAVAHQVERERGQQDRGPRHEDQPRGQAHEAVAAAHVGAPRGLGRLDAHAQEGQRGLGQQREGDPDGHLHHHRGHHVRQHVAGQHARVAGAGGARALHERLLAEREHLPAHEAREARRVDDAHRHHHVEEPGAERGRDGHGQDQRREGLEGVDHPHQRVVDGPAQVTGDQADGHAGQRRDRHRQARGAQREARAVEQAREHVAPQVVGAEEVRGRGRGQHAAEILLDRIVRGHHRREQRARDQQPEVDHAHHRGAAPREAPEREPHLTHSGCADR